MREEPRLDARGEPVEPEEAKATGPLALTALVGGVVSLFGLLAVLLVGFVSVGLPLVGLGALVGLVGGVGSLVAERKRGRRTVAVAVAGLLLALVAAAAAVAFFMAYLAMLESFEALS